VPHLRRDVAGIHAARDHEEYVILGAALQRLRRRAKRDGDDHHPARAATNREPLIAAAGVGEVGLGPLKGARCIRQCVR